MAKEPATEYEKTWGDAFRDYAVSTGSDTLDNQIKNLYSQSYRQMMDAENQAAAARANALKYTTNQMMGGYGTQGMSESTRLGIENSYRNAMAQAGADFQNAMQKNYQTAAGMKTENENQMKTDYTDLIYSAQTDDDLKSYANIFGATLNDDGTWNYNAEGSKYTENLMNYLSSQSKAAYDAINGVDETKDTDYETGVTVKGLGSAIQTSWKNEDGDEIVSNLANKGYNDNFNISINGQNYKVELGKKFTMPVSLQKQYMSMKTGEIRAIEVDGGYILITRDNNNDYRRIDHAGVVGDKGKQFNDFGKVFGVPEEYTVKKRKAGSGEITYTK